MQAFSPISNESTTDHSKQSSNEITLPPTDN